MEMIKINQSNINDELLQTVNARDLHEFLESKQEYSNWVKARIAKYDFIEGVDFTIDKIIIGKNKQINHHITVDMAKELSMVERNDKGKQARQYFIECEKRARQPIDPMQLLNDPAAMRGLLSTYSEKVLVLEDKVAEMKPDSDALKRISLSDGSMCITDAAKTLQIQPKKLFEYLRVNNWIYRRVGGKGYVGYQRRLITMDLEHKITTISQPDGSERVTEQVRVTPKGLAKLAKELELTKAA